MLDVFHQAESKKALLPELSMPPLVKASRATLPSRLPRLCCSTPPTLAQATRVTPSHSPPRAPCAPSPPLIKTRYTASVPLAKYFAIEREAIEERPTDPWPNLSRMPFLRNTFLVRFVPQNQSSFDSHCANLSYLYNLEYTVSGGPTCLYYGACLGS